MLKLFFIFLSFCLPLFAKADQYIECGNNEAARELVKLITTDTAQKRDVIRCNKLLTQAAEAKAKKMADFGLVAHNLGGSPNASLERVGYKLPDYYGRQFDSNQVEAIAGGYVSAISVWRSFKLSDGHRAHLLGEHEFYSEQDEIGAAFIQETASPHVEYWVVYLTKGYQKNQSYSGDQNKIPNKGLFILEKSKN